tara:strand:- start:658 stop:858 length:201 start_codon:yes stop_codon:yes gene_type:complete
MKIKVKHQENDMSYGVYMYCVSNGKTSVVPIKYFYYNKDNQDKQWQECLKYAKYIEDQIRYRQRDD